MQKDSIKKSVVICEDHAKKDKYTQKQLANKFPKISYDFFETYNNFLDDHYKNIRFVARIVGLLGIVCWIIIDYYIKFINAGLFLNIIVGFLFGGICGGLFLVAVCKPYVLLLPLLGYSIGYIFDSKDGANVFGIIGLLKAATVGIRMF